MTLSTSARTRLQRELERLDAELLPQARRAVEEARQQGDMSQNPDFFLAAEAEGRLLVRRESVSRALADEGEQAAIDGHVVPGAVLVLDFGDGPEEFIFGSIEEQHGSVQVLTPSSPIGLVLLGAPVGSTLCTVTGIKVTVLDVRPS